MAAAVARRSTIDLCDCLQLLHFHLSMMTVVTTLTALSDDRQKFRGVMKKQAVVESALELAKDALHIIEMGLMRAVHVKAHLRDCVDDVRSGEVDVLESLGQAAVGSLVADRGTHVGGELCLSVYRHGVGLAVTHASALKV
jgi:hypothetical protein